MSDVFEEARIAQKTRGDERCGTCGHELRQHGFIKPPWDLQCGAPNCQCRTFIFAVPDPPKIVPAAPRAQKHPWPHEWREAPRTPGAVWCAHCCCFLRKSPHLVTYAGPLELLLAPRYGRPKEQDACSHVSTRMTSQRWCAMCGYLEPNEGEPGGCSAAEVAAKSDCTPETISGAVEEGPSAQMMQLTDALRAAVVAERKYEEAEAARANLVEKLNALRAALELIGCGAQAARIALRDVPRE